MLGQVQNDEGNECAVNVIRLLVDPGVDGLLRINVGGILLVTCMSRKTIPFFTSDVFSANEV